MKKQAKRILITLVLLAGIQLASAQFNIFTPVTLNIFTAGNGAYPYAGLVQASDGNFYGTTYQGGSDNFGSVFQITTNGVLTSLYSFTNGNDGANPYDSLVQANDGNLYGTTFNGGTNGFGTVFRITTSGTLTPLYSFTDGNDGAWPRAGLVQASDGNLYGTTASAIFRITTSGALTPVYTFTGGNDGAWPDGALVQASDGNLYGTAEEGGTNGWGTVFRFTTNDVFTPLYSFTGGNDGANPVAGLVQASDGNLYGTAGIGGGNGAGTVFRIATTGVFTLLYSFTGGADGLNLESGLVQAGDGYLYGTTFLGGAYNGGTIFRITTNGVKLTLYSFTGYGDGAWPDGALVQASDGNLYGTTMNGGTNGWGTVFAFNW